jgi:hypothetical protein
MAVLVAMDRPEMAPKEETRRSTSQLEKKEHRKEHPEA